MSGHLFLAQGDLTQLTADAIAFSASSSLGRDGDLCSSFEANIPGFAEEYRRLRQRAGVPLRPGSAFWLPLGHGGKPHGVTVVVSTGRGEDIDKPGLAVRNALAVAEDNLRLAGRTGRLLIALPGFRVGRGGDHARRLESARAQVRAALQALSEMSEVDVAFILYTPDLYRIFLEARREALGACPLPVSPALEQSFREGTCVLFAGAGLSSGAGLPSWAELIGQLGRELGIDNPHQFDALDVAQWYRAQFGSERLAEKMRATFAGSGLPTLAHYLLLALPLRHVVTTNYDGLIERALDALKRHPVPVVRQEDVTRTGGNAGVYVTKLHGDASNPEEIVLSRDDYDTFLERRPAMALLLEGLLLNQTFFFVGYSLRDPNFRSIFSRIARMLRESRHPAFATNFETEGAAAEHMRRQWRAQQLEMLPILGANRDEQKRAFMIFLDGLAERVTLLSPGLVLAHDTPTPRGLERVFSELNEAGRELEELAGRSRLDDDTLRFLADLLRFLLSHGWRPSGRTTPASLWRELAGHARSRELRRQLLVSALASAEALAVVQKVRREIEELDQARVKGEG